MHILFTLLFTLWRLSIITSFLLILHYIFAAIDQLYLFLWERHTLIYIFLLVRPFECDCFFFMNLIQSQKNIEPKNTTKKIKKKQYVKNQSEVRKISKLNKKTINMNSFLVKIANWKIKSFVLNSFLRKMFFFLLLDIDCNRLFFFSNICERLWLIFNFILIIQMNCLRKTFDYFVNLV